MKDEMDKIQKHEDTKKLSLVVLFLSMFVVAILGLAPII